MKPGYMWQQCLLLLKLLFVFVMHKMSYKKAYWMLPTSLRDVPHKPVSEIDFAVPRSKQKELSKAINKLTSNNESGDNDERKLNQIKTMKTKEKKILSPSDQEMMTFSSSCQNAIIPSL